MQKNPLVTVICLSYNHEKFVVEALNSVLQQKYSPVELIVVDDCSTDKSASIIDNWCLQQNNITFIKNEQNSGNTKSFNKALKIASGDYIIDLAADDVLTFDGIELQVAAFKQSTFKNLGIVYGNAEIINENGSFNSYYFPVNANKNVIKKRQAGAVYASVLTSGDSICSVSAMIKKNVYDDLNGYDETLHYEDLDFWIRAARVYEFDFIDAVLIKKRIVSNSLSSHFYKKNNKINESTYKILKKAFLLNQTKVEDLALQKRIHFEIIHSFKNRNFNLLLKNISLKIKISWRIMFIK